MHVALSLVILAVAVTAVSASARRWNLSAPLVLVVAGFVASYVPFVPTVTLTPELVLVGLLPPLLYAASLRTSLIDFRRNKRPIALLSVGLVLFTTAGIGLLVWWLLPVPLAAALALGAVVAPPDAVSTTSIARRVGMPRRVVTILEGESLVNDATAIVTLRTAVAGIAGSVTLWGTVGRFALSAVGGAVVGVIVAVVVGKIRSHIDDDLTDVAVSMLTPWVAYIPAEQIHGSGVLAVVVAGLLLGHKSPAIQSATSRIFERTIWATVSFLLENAVFLLIGMQVRSVLHQLSTSTLPTSQIVLAGVATLVAVMVLRIVWVFPSTYLPRLIPAIARADPAPPWRVPTLVSWAGMRGVVTLAAAFLIPEQTPQREVLVAIAFLVAAGTLLIQGTTLPILVRTLGIGGPDPAEDYLQQAGVYQRAARAGLNKLDSELTGAEPEEVVERLRRRSLERANAVWEMLGTKTETPSLMYARLRTDMLQAERQEVLHVRRLGLVDQTVLAQVLVALDVEETVLDQAVSSSSADREEDLVTPPHHSGCDDLHKYERVPRPGTPDGCEECLRDGTEWVHLRLCMVCGHVGCCDSSPQTHATRHWQAVGHPVMRSFETGEAWRWCFDHQLLG
ncbi:MAG: Na+/H+ antiporter [Nocardioidaceae bacterium]